MSVRVRDFESSDAELINKVALAAFGEFKTLYDDWDIFSGRISNMAELAAKGAEIVVATDDAGRVIGAVAYVGPGKPKADFFDVDWPIIRMLVVDPAHRGLGAGKALTMNCIDRAVRDAAPVVALHTSPIMNVALPMYLRMGFLFERVAPPIHGVAYDVYLKRLA